MAQKESDTSSEMLQVSNSFSGPFLFNGQRMAAVDTAIKSVSLK
jgi:hypothetical protein